MENLKIIGAVISLIAYLPLWYGIIKNTVKISFATYFLWATLDAVTVTIIVIMGGKDFWLPLGYVVGSGATALVTTFEEPCWLGHIRQHNDSSGNHNINSLVYLWT